MALAPYTALATNYLKVRMEDRAFNAELAAINVEFYRRLKAVFDARLGWIIAEYIRTGDAALRNARLEALGRKRRRYDKALVQVGVDLSKWR